MSVMILHSKEHVLVKAVANPERTYYGQVMFASEVGIRLRVKSELHNGIGAWTPRSEADELVFPWAGIAGITVLDIAGGDEPPKAKKKRRIILPQISALEGRFIEWIADKYDPARASTRKEAFKAGAILALKYRMQYTPEEDD